MQPFAPDALWAAQAQLYDSLPSRLWLAGRDGHITFVNRAWEDYTGTSRGAALGRPFAEAIHGDDREAALGRWTQAWLSGTPYRSEFRLRGAEGGYRWHLSQGRASAAGPGGETVWAGLCTDIHDRVEAEARARQLLRDCPVGILMADASGRVVEANPAFLSLLGYSEADLDAGLTWAGLTPPEFAALDRQAAAALTRDGRLPAYEKEYLRRDGTRVPVLVGGTLLPGDAPRGVGYVLDLREARAREHALRGALARSRALHEVSVALSAARDEAGVRDVLFGLGFRMAGASLGSLGLLVADGEGLEVTELESLARVGEVERHRLSLDAASPGTDALRRGEAVLLPNRAAIAAAYPHFAPDLSALASLPFEAAGVRGAVVLGFAQPQTFGAHEREFLDTLVCQLAQALARVRALAAATLAAGRHGALLGTLSPVIWTLDAQTGRDALTLRWWQALTGQDAEAQMAEEGWGWLRALHGDDREPVRAAWTRALSGSEAVVSTFRVHTPSGEVRAFEMRAAPNLDAAGQLIEWVGSATDVTGRVRAEARLLGQARLLQQIAAGVPAPAVLTELTAMVEATCRPGGAASVLRIDRAAGVFRLGAAPSLPPEYRAAVDGCPLDVPGGVCALAAQAGGAVYAADLLGDPRWTALREISEAGGRRACWSVPVTAPGGEVLGTLALYHREARDPDAEEQALLATGADLAALLFERERRDDEVRHGRAQLQAVLDHTASVVYLTDLDGRYLLVNRRWQEVFPELGKVSGRTLAEVWPPDVAQTFWDNFQEARARGEPVVSEEVAPHADGPRTYLSIKFALRDATGQPYALCGMSTDISERKALEVQLRHLTASLEERVEQRTAELRAERERAEVLARLGETLQGLEVPADLAPEHLGALAGALEVHLLGLVPVQAGRVGAAVLWGEADAALRALLTRPGVPLAEAPLSGLAAHQGAGLYLDAGDELPGAGAALAGRAVAGEAVRAADGALLGVLLVTRPAQRGAWNHETRALLRRAAALVGLALERLRAAEELRAANVALRRSNEELERFAYIASHDLQEPIRTVASFADLLELRDGGALGEAGRQRLAVVRGGALRLKTLVDDLLGYSRLGGELPALGPVDLAAPLAEALGRLQARLQDSGARVSHDPLPEVLGHGPQLAQLLQNLLGNALKFTRPGRPPVVHVGARPEGETWVVSVTDQGIGIEAAYLERIFGMFQRLHTRDQYDGTGLGLAICRKVVETHGGRLWVESTPGAGSTFFFTLRAASTAGNAVDG